VAFCVLRTRAHRSGARARRGQRVYRIGHFGYAELSSTSTVLRTEHEWYLKSQAPNRIHISENGPLRIAGKIASLFRLAPHLNPLPRYSLRGGGEETNAEVTFPAILSVVITLRRDDDNSGCDARQSTLQLPFAPPAACQIPSRFST
jgi:hypothetical protein